MRALVLLVLIASCDSDSNQSPMVDAPAGPSCTGAVYDPCTTNDQCSSMNCKFYMQSNFTVCTQTCTPLDNSTCPVDSGGNHGTCNMMGLCKPASPNACSR